VAVVGLGDYYSKLRPALWRVFSPVALLDQEPQEYLSLRPEEKVLFSQINADSDIQGLCRAADIVLVLTSNDTHVRFAEPLLRSGKPTVIEKPLATTSEDLERLGVLARAGAPIYCSDFYVDVRAAPLLYFAGLLDRTSWLARRIEGRRGLWGQLSSLGGIRRIEARLLEVYPFRHDSWLGREPAGGVIFDMLVHLLALIRRLFPAADLELHWCTRQFCAPNDPPGHYHNRPAVAGSAEAYARVEGRLDSGVAVLLEVGKSAPVEDRYLWLDGERGQARQRFGPQEPLEFNMRGQEKSLHILGDRYDLTVEAMLQWYREGASTYGWDWGEWAVSKLLEIRQWYPPTLVPTKHQPGPEATAGPPSPTLTRRDFFYFAGIVVQAALGVATIASGAHDVADEVRVSRDRAGRVTEPLERASEAPQRYVTETRLRQVARLIGNCHHLAFIPGSEHRYGEPIKDLLAFGFPHDRAAIAPFRLLSTDPVCVLEDSAVPGFVAHSDLVVSTGSPSSSRVARRLMESSVRIENLPYVIREIAGDPFVRVISGMEGGTEKVKRGKELVDGSSGEVLISDHENVSAAGWLERDALLLSRLPSAGGDYDVLLLSGGHGAGTQAAELLFDPRIIPNEDFARLLALIAEQPYWQIVFEVLDIHHQAPMSIAHGIRLSPFFSPKTFSPRFGKASGVVV